jgi:NAD+ diphosphatase
VNSAVYPEEVDHLIEHFGQPERELFEIPVDNDFVRSFQASLQRRRAEVGLVIRREGGRVLLTTKAFYPSGIFRLPTGGIKPGEPVEEAFWRELGEETGLAASNPRFAALSEYRLTSRAGAVRFATYLFIVDAPEGEPRCTDPHEAICAFREIPPEDLAGVADKLANLGPGWRSWGIWRAIPHRVAGGILAGHSPP